MIWCLQWSGAQNRTKCTILYATHHARHHVLLPAKHTPSQTNEKKNYICNVVISTFQFDSKLEIKGVPLTTLLLRGRTSTLNHPWDTKALFKFENVYFLCIYSSLCMHLCIRYYVLILLECIPCCLPPCLQYLYLLKRWETERAHKDRTTKNIEWLSAATVHLIL